MAKLVNNMTLGIAMNAVADGLKLGGHYDLPKAELFDLLKVSTGDSWVDRNWGDISEWTADTALAVLLKDLKAAHAEGLKHSIALPFNALSSVFLFNAMGKTSPTKSDRRRLALRQNTTKRRDPELADLHGSHLGFHRARMPET